jgi:hypothetical protein
MSVDGHGVLNTFWHSIPLSDISCVGNKWIKWNIFRSHWKGTIAWQKQAVAEWLKHYAANLKVAGSIPDEVNFKFT